MILYRIEGNLCIMFLVFNIHLLIGCVLTGLLPENPSCFFFIVLPKKMYQEVVCAISLSGRDYGGFPVWSVFPLHLYPPMRRFGEVQGAVSINSGLKKSAGSVHWAGQRPKYEERCMFCLISCSGGLKSSMVQVLHGTAGMLESITDE